MSDQATFEVAEGWVRPLRDGRTELFVRHDGDTMNVAGPWDMVSHVLSLFEQQHGCRLTDVQILAQRGTRDECWHRNMRHAEQRARELAAVA